MREINVPALGVHRFMMNDAGEAFYLTTRCHGNCGSDLRLDGARVCAILICRTCHQDPKKLTAARSENGRHMRAHTIHERQTNPWYPFEDFHTAWSAA